MAHSDEARRDEGIQDVLVNAELRDRKELQSESEHVEVTGKRDNGDLENSETEDFRKRQNGQPEATGDMNNANPDMQLDLADPESVIRMLETVDLTDEDTEGLLQEAYNMNRKLKEMLRRQESGSSSHCSKSKPKNKPKQKITQDSSTSSTNSSEAGSRVGSSFGARKILPPIMGEKETSVYAIKLKRSRTNIVDSKPTFIESSVLRSKSTKPQTRKVLYK